MFWTKTQMQTNNMIGAEIQREPANDVQLKF